jgi:hypothetical protein
MESTSSPVMSKFRNFKLANAGPIRALSSSVDFSNEQNNGILIPSGNPYKIPKNSEALLVANRKQFENPSASIIGATTKPTNTHRSTKKEQFQDSFITSLEEPTDTFTSISNDKTRSRRNKIVHKSVDFDRLNLLASK